MMQGSSGSSKLNQDFGQRLSDEIRQNPVPAALVGMGLLWLFMGGNRTTISQMATGASPGSQLASTGKRTGEALLDAASSAAGAVSDAATDLTSGATQAVSNAAGAVQQGGSQLFRTLQRDLSDLFERQPLAVGGIGLALGAAIGSAFATTQLEAETFGEASQATRKEAEDLISTGLDKAREVGARVARE